MQPCEGVIGWLMGHDFQPRYDESSTGPKPGVDGFFQSTLKIEGDKIEQASPSEKTIYVHDVCSRCGMVVKRRDDEQGQKSKDEK